MPAHCGSSDVRHLPVAEEDATHKDHAYVVQEVDVASLEGWRQRSACFGSQGFDMAFQGISKQLAVNSSASLANTSSLKGPYSGVPFSFFRSDFLISQNTCSPELALVDPLIAPHIVSGQRFPGAPGYRTNPRNDEFTWVAPTGPPQPHHDPTAKPFACSLCCPASQSFLLRLRDLLPSFVRWLVRKARCACWQ